MADYRRAVACAQSIRRRRSATDAQDIDALLLLLVFDKALRVAATPRHDVLRHDAC